MEMATNKYPTYVRMEPSLHDKLLKIAEGEKRSMNSLIVYILSKWIEELEKDRGDTSG
jgi:hypothetical protein